MDNLTNISVWLKGLVATVIGGASNAIVMIIVDPLQFNLAEGAHNLLVVAATSAIVSAAMYLKQSPLPGGNQ